MANGSPYTCERCGEQGVDTRTRGGRPIKFCPPCRPEAKKERNRQYMAERSAALRPPPRVYVCDRCGADVVRAKGGPPVRYCAECRPNVQRERERQWALKNRERANATKKRWRLRHPEQMKAARARWEAANPEARRGYRRSRKKKDPISNRSYVRARKARLRSSALPFTAEELRQRLAFYRGRCWMCGADANVIDHVKPISKGGAHMLCNLRPACHDCNTRKGARWPYPTSRSSSRGDLAARPVNATCSGSFADGTTPAGR